MRTLKLIFILFIILSFGITLSAQRRGGQGRGQGKGRKYNQTREDKVQPCYGMNTKIDLTQPKYIKGKIVYVEKIKFGNGFSDAIHLSVKNENGIKVIHAGPETFFDSKNIVFKLGDDFSGIVYEGEYNNKTSYFASELMINGEKIVLRDKNGLPQWKGSLKSNNKNGKRRGRGRR